MYYCDLETREAREIVAGVRMKTFWQEKMLMAIVNLDAGAIVPRHSHEHEQFGLVTAGELTFTIGGETRVLRTGDCYTIPGHVEHSVVAHNGPAVAIDIFAPVREAYQY